MKNFNAIETLESRLFLSITPGGMHMSQDGTGDIAVTVPAKPSALTAAATGAAVTLHWTDNSTNETGFVVQRYIPGAAAGKNLVDVGTVSADVTTFTDTKAANGTDYYLVRSFNSNGRSEGSNGISVTVHAEPVITVVAPNRLKTMAVSSTKIGVTWTGDLGATGGYTIQRASSSSTGWTSVGTAAVGVKTFLDIGLTAKTKYYYRIIAIGAGKTSATSSPVLGMTASGDSIRK